MALNAVQREIQDTLKKHPNWTSIQALHWNRKHNPATIARHKRERAASRKYDRDKNTLMKAQKFAKSLKVGGKRKVVPNARLNGGKILARHRYDGNVEIVYAVDKHTLAEHVTGIDSFRNIGDHRFGSENSNFSGLAKQIFKGTRGKASMGSRGG